MIAVFCDTGRVFDFNLYFPRSEFRKIQRIEDVRGSVKFTGVIVLDRFRMTREEEHALEALKSKQPELFVNEKS